MLMATLVVLLMEAFSSKHMAVVVVLEEVAELIMVGAAVVEQGRLEQ